MRLLKLCLLGLFLGFEALATTPTLERAQRAYSQFNEQDMPYFFLHFSADNQELRKLHRLCGKSKKQENVSSLIGLYNEYGQQALAEVSGTSSPQVLQKLAADLDSATQALNEYLQSAQELAICSHESYPNYSDGDLQHLVYLNGKPAFLFGYGRPD